MSKNVRNRVRILLAGVGLLTVVFAIIALAVPFDPKWDSLVYWISFGGVILALGAVAMFAFITLNPGKFNTDASANKVVLFGGAYFVVQLIVSIVFLCVNSADFKAWIPVVVIAVLFAVKVFLMIVVLLLGEGSDEEEKKEE